MRVEINVVEFDRLEKQLSWEVEVSFTKEEMDVEYPELENIDDSQTYRCRLTEDLEVEREVLDVELFELGAVIEAVTEIERLVLGNIRDYIV